MMFSGSRKFVLIGLFTLILIVGVNSVWWVNYERTAELLEQQHIRRLTIVASHGSANISEASLTGLLEGELDPFIELTEYLENLRQSDSLAEVFLLDESYSYLATTLIEPDTSYFLADLNGPIIDSIFYNLSGGVHLSPTYQSGEIYLKAAFAGVYDSRGSVIAVLGVEASVDYFDALVDLKKNLYLSTLISIGGGILAGLILIILQIRINRAEGQAFQNRTQLFLGQMVAVVAHEIRNPLAIIRGSAERIKTRDKAEEAGFIIEETDRLNSIVTGYLEFAKGGKSILGADRKVSFTFSELLAEVRHRLDLELAPAQIDWLQTDESPKIQITGYRHSLSQVLFNLALNGAQAALEKNLPIQIGISATETDLKTEITVSDNGGGMTSRQLKNAFTPFYTTRQQGSGLGLFLSRNIIEEMNGSLQATSENSGLTVRLILPK